MQNDREPQPAAPQIPFARGMSGPLKQSNPGREVRDEISAEIDVAVSKPGSILQKVLPLWLRGFRDLGSIVRSHESGGRDSAQCQQQMNR